MTFKPATKNTLAQSVIFGVADTAIAKTTQSM